jgi:hypothetical protein
LAIYLSLNLNIKSSQIPSILTNQLSSNPQL